MLTAETTRPEIDILAVAERYRQVARMAEDALSHMDTSLALVEAQVAVARHHQTHRLAQDVAAG